MIGSVAVAGFIAHAAFWILLAWGALTAALRWRGIASFVVLWIAGRIALPFTAYGLALFPSYLAVLDIVLVLMIFRGDVRIT